MIYLCLALLALCGWAGQCEGSIVVTNAHRHDRNGIYELTSLGCDGKPVWRMPPSGYRFWSSYIYWNSANMRWYVSSDACNSPWYAWDFMSADVPSPDLSTQPWSNSYRGSVLTCLEASDCYSEHANKYLPVSYPSSATRCTGPYYAGWCSLVEAKAYCDTLSDCGGVSGSGNQWTVRRPGELQNSGSYEIVWLKESCSSVAYLGSDIHWNSCTTGWGSCTIDHDYFHNSHIEINGKSYLKGIVQHAAGSITFTLYGAYDVFSSCIGISRYAHDSRCGVSLGDARFRVLGDGEVRRDWEVKGSPEDPTCFDVSIEGVTTLTLETDLNGSRDCDLSTWANAKVYKLNGRRQLIEGEEGNALFKSSTRARKH